MKKRIILTAAAALAFAPVVGSVLNTHNAIEIQAQVQQGTQMVALGGSLDAQQAQETLALLGAGQIDQASITYIDGTVINRFLQDGSDTTTPVYSSAYIQGMAEGYGVQVQIVTPQNILEVSPSTYQNAAITAGASNVQIKVATVTPVTGEGALAGVYALLEQQGVTLNQQDIQIAQHEIELINEINQDDSNELSDDLINQISAEIKQAITQELTGGNEEVDVDAIVDSIMAEYDITDETTIALFKEIARGYLETEAAQNADTNTQLEQSIQAPWVDVLSGLEGAVDPGELLEQEALDFSDSSIYHPILQGFADEMYRIIGAGEVIDSVYNDSFIFELMTPDMSNADRKALNDLRTIMYQYAANNDAVVASGSIKEDWLNNIYAYANLKADDPAMGEMVTRIALASGRAPQVYAYQAITQEDTVITFENRWFSPEGHSADFTQFTFDVADDSMQQLDFLTGELTELTGAYDFSQKYGQVVENNYIYLDLIPADYTIPGFVPTEEESDEEESEVEETELSDEETSLPEESDQPETSESMPEISEDEAVDEGSETIDE